MLLDIAEAAALLNVSEASLRRWTNRGLLRCVRIGGRRERRFYRADLLAFLEGQSRATPAEHCCGLYTSDLGRIRLAARLVTDALSAGRVCILAAEPPVRARVLAQLGPRPAEHLTVIGYAASAPAQLRSWETQFKTLTRKGARSIHVVGDVSGGRLARRHDFAQILEYEAAYDTMARRYSVATMCLYDARAHSGLEVSSVLARHPDSLRHPVAQLVS